jgi:hypothetical protein
MLSPQNHKVYEHAIATLWFDEDGILNFISKPVHRDLAIMMDYVNFVKSISTEKVCLLADISHTTPLDKETREYLGKHLQDIYKAMALLSNRPGPEMVGKTFLALNDQPYPTAMFHDVNSARTWLKQYV